MTLQGNAYVKGTMCMNNASSFESVVTTSVIKRTNDICKYKSV